MEGVPGGAGRRSVAGADRPGQPWCWRQSDAPDNVGGVGEPAYAVDVSGIEASKGIRMRRSNAFVDAFAFSGAATEDMIAAVGGPPH